MTARAATVHYERPVCSDHGLYLDPLAGGHACQTPNESCRADGCVEVVCAIDGDTGEGVCIRHLPADAVIA